MTKLAFKMAQTQAINNKKLKHGIDLFEKYIGRIEWLHPDENPCEIKGNKKYAVANEMGEIIFEADKLYDIAKEFCVSASRISNCLNMKRLLDGKYMIVRCENE